MTAAENTALMRRYYDDLNAGRLLETLGAYIADDLVAHSGDPARRSGLAGWRHTLVRALAAMPDQQLILTHLVAEGDLVVAHGRRIAHW